VRELLFGAGGGVYLGHKAGNGTYCEFFENAGETVAAKVSQTVGTVRNNP
jgi:hypothetical protein